MKREPTMPANDNKPLKVRMAEAFPQPRTIYGNPINGISGTWFKGEEYLYVGRSKEGFHAAISIPRDEYPLVFGKAYPTAKEATASVRPPKKSKNVVERFARPIDKTPPTKKPPSRSR
jgi:hypothetical protein